ncbi:phosphoglycerate mutase family member 5, putative [Leishmania donovani]|uniref:Serine/threonine-protein phosphatase PGAM5, mitochondrial n=1 Tax=Leishmania donovani TaxID=5661 RepID=A0A3S7XBE7_LEIDO|nr:phosphoglycerate mutase family member 5, putative [Leishmania donovani]AYU83783.1 phosphoglycerate mutase family member 5, putative [Leishmania donovani]TPP48533.1 Histidine phosphatase (branch 1) family protein [Leishmania donovani]CBZ38864.1 phosphoglycerate mutase family member 5, putative [Leishmania donovani]
MSFTFRRFLCSVGIGFAASPLLRGAAVALCETVKPAAPPGMGSAAHISANGLANHLFDEDPLPTKEELQYVKTWGVPWVEDWDRPGNRGIRADRSASHQRQVIMIRHGQYGNEGVNDDKIHRLTPLGERQARETGVYLRRLFEESDKRKKLNAIYRQARRAYKQAKNDGASEEQLTQLERKMDEARLVLCGAGGILVDAMPMAVHVSDMTRAKQTADLILEAFPEDVRLRKDVDPQLRERIPCAVQPVRPFTPSAEDMHVAEAVFERYFHRPVESGTSVEIIVGHANMIRYLTMRALQLPPEAWLRTSLPHCSVTTITIRGTGHVSLVGMGSYGHLPPDMVTVSNVK